MDPVTIGIASVVIICFFLYFSQRDQRMPPGPTKWPLIGNLLTLCPRDYVAFTRWKKYGEVITVHFGPVPVVVLNSYNAVSQAFLGQAEVFSGRFKSDYFDIITHHSGIIFKDGPIWQEHRRFTLRLLREFGLGRDMAEEIILEECEALCKKFDTLIKSDVETRPLFTAAINNVIARISFGERCGSDDPEFADFTRNLDDSFQFRFIDLLPMICPWIIKIPPLLRLVEKASQMRCKIESMHSYIRKKIDARITSLPSSASTSTDISQATNLCEAFLIEQFRLEKTAPGKHSFTDWQIIRNMFELFIAGTETTSTTLTWATLLLATHPNIQHKAQQEIFEKIGRERAPKMSDLKELPYLHAVMDEVLRYSSLVPSNVGHRAMQDTQLMGYFIPGDTMISCNLYGIHHDPELWERPEEFYPEHFLNASGEYQPSKFLIPFSLGKRACLGEALARMEYFIALTLTIQRFQMRLKETDEARLSKILYGTDGGVRQPLHHSIIFSRID